MAEKYVRLLCAEKEVIEGTGAFSASPVKELDKAQWSVLIGLTRTLPHEQEDFFLASHDPVLARVVQRLAGHYDLPERLWRNSNKAILEILQQRIPDHLENMIAYVDLSFKMLSRLDAKFPELGDRWAECMQDLETYRDFLEGIRVNGSNSDEELPPSSVADQHLCQCSENGEASSSGGSRSSDATFQLPPQRDGTHYFPFLGAGQSIHWLFGSGGSESSDDSQSLAPDNDFGGCTDDETKIQEEFDRWFSGLTPKLFDAEGKNKWVLLGWLHYGKHLARSFWSYQRVFKVLLLNVLL
ncbi:uncharacterized protein A1O5_06547 [Cladophialophora psammophila CBS 110553]|uniref:Uncharacterized protein n=1 Tax=Cladophialophora psammophila CBS 110553 TaxID=1182543 RepID=W9WRD5_9EURO|nr:uncharacterized protein A1O5_06547 [Cladophialophora psammophila CBS 110553]EXJ70478.1 hypothetical protein A1O5_06547 [Cladophialophora psammophila CBS 110553]